MSKLFEKQGSHPIFERVREPERWVRTIPGGTDQMRREKIDSYLRLRNRMECAWSIFKHSAENNFLDGLRRSFWPGWFELRIQNILAELQLENRATNGEGEPDFIVYRDTGHLFNLEATVLTAGSGASSVLGLPMPETGKPIFQDLSEFTTATTARSGQQSESDEVIRNPYSQNDICLRITAALSSKNAQIEKWINNDDKNMLSAPMIVAISSAQFDYETSRFICDSQFELALYGKGALTIPIEGGEPNIESAYFASREKMSNKNDSEIQLGVFHTHEYRHISSVAYFSEGLLDCGNPPPVFFINHNATNPLSSDALPVGKRKEYVHDAIVTSH